MAEDKPLSLLDVARLKNVSPGPTCRFVPLLTDHPLADEIRALLAACGTEIRYSTARDVLKSAGIEMSSDTISRHVRKACSCPS